MQREDSIGQGKGEPAGQQIRETLQWPYSSHPHAPPADQFPSQIAAGEAEHRAGQTGEHVERRPDQERRGRRHGAPVGRR